MEDDGYGLKLWKHIAFRQKNQQRWVSWTCEFASIVQLEQKLADMQFEEGQIKRIFDDLAFEQKRIQEITKQLQICISKREYYEGCRQNPNDKIYFW